jgi:hypothetical protein
MTEEKTRKLFERFKFFHPERSLNESLMGFGFECSDGWFNIIWDLCEKIEKELNEHGNDPDFPFEVLQVKEKFGGLRFYTNWETKEIGDLINEAEEKSYKTCEVCGKEGELMTKGYWLQTLCPKHAKEENFMTMKEYEEKAKEIEG